VNDARGSDTIELGRLTAALGAAERVLDGARRVVARRVTSGGRIDAARLDDQQTAAHGLAWLATYVEALRQVLAWTRRLDDAGRLGPLERAMALAAYGEYLAQMAGGLPMSQGEIVRLGDLGVEASDIVRFAQDPAVSAVCAEAGAPAARARLATLLAEAADGGELGDPGFADETLVQVRDQFRRFVETRVVAEAPRWHGTDTLIPMAVIDDLAAMGVFGLTVPEEHGGLGLSKTAMCVVTEELSRGYIGVGSLGTRSEIAAELIRHGGTDEQKRDWLPGLAAGTILPTAVFTEPGTGSDLGSLKTRAVRDGEVWRITGNKTWITHAARADVMTLLARTDPDEKGYRGLSMFLAPKPRGTDAEPFPAPGMKGTEIRVLGYRGMKEYELAFDGFAVPAANLLGGVPGQGFKQLMATFESARIQTAARAVGVARNATELALAYARGRQQFGKAIYGFPRVANKIAWMATETMVARQITWFAAEEKDKGRRCDLEAGMAKLLAARVAWAAADNAVQVHGGNGYAEEYPISRVLVDARILNVFEGAAEIQAHVIARRLLEDGRN
jgi:(2S)-methylsuccinyl-CoA dehydrogenase